MCCKFIWETKLKVLRWIIEFFTFQFIIVVLLSYGLIYSTLIVFSNKEDTKQLNPQTTFALEAHEILIIQDGKKDQTEYSFQKTCSQVLKSKYCKTYMTIPFNVTATTQKNEFKNLNVSCSDNCEIQYNSTKYQPENVFIYGDNVKLTISQMITTQFLVDIQEGRILIEDLFFPQAKINLGKGDLAIQTQEDITLTSITNQKYLCITSAKVFKKDSITVISNIQEIMQTRNETNGEKCQKIFPFKQRNHQQMINKIMHPIFDGLQNTSIMQFEETRCNYIEEARLLGTGSDFNKLKKLFISSSEGNIYINVLKNQKKMGDLLLNNYLESNTKLNFTEESASKLKQTIESISNSGRSQDILLLNFRNNYQTTTSTFIILFNPITLFSTPMTVSLFSFGTLSNKQEQYSLDLVPNVCPYIFSDDYLEKVDGSKYSESIPEQRKNMFKDLIKQYFYDQEIKVFTYFNYDEYNKIAFPKLETFPNQDEASKRIKILYISMIPFSIFGIYILYKAFNLMRYYLRKAAAQRKLKDREKILFSLLPLENENGKNENSLDQSELSHYVNKNIEKQKNNNQDHEYYFVNESQLTLYTAQYLFQSVINWFEFKKLNSFEVFCKVIFEKMNNNENKKTSLSSKIFPIQLQSSSYDSQSSPNSSGEKIKSKEMRMSDLESRQEEQGVRNNTSNDDEQKSPMKKQIPQDKVIENYQNVKADIFKETYQLFCYINNMNEQYIFSQANISILAEYKYIIELDKKNPRSKIIKQKEGEYEINGLILNDLFSLVQYNLIVNKEAKQRDTELEFFKNKCKTLFRFFTGIKSLITKCRHSKQQQNSTDEIIPPHKEQLKNLKQYINTKYEKYKLKKNGFFLELLNKVVQLIAALLVPVAFFSPTIIFVWIFTEENAKYMFNLKRIYPADYKQNVNANYEIYKLCSDILFWHAISLTFVFSLLLVLNGMYSFSSKTRNTQRIYFQKISTWQKIKSKIKNIYDLLGMISTYLLIIHMIAQVAYIYIVLIIIIVGSIVFSKVELPFLIFFSFLITAIAQLSHSFDKNYENGRKKFKEIFKNNYLNKVDKYKKEKHQSPNCNNETEKKVSYYLDNKDNKQDNSNFINIIIDAIKNSQESHNLMDYKYTDLDQQFEEFQLLDENDDKQIQINEIKVYFQNIQMDLNDVQMNQLVAQLINPVKSQFQFMPNEQIDFQKFKRLIEIFINQKVEMGLSKMGVSYQVLLRSIFKIISLSIFAGFFVYIIFVSFIVGEQDIDLLSSNGIISAGGIISVIMLKEDKSQVLNDEKLVEESALEVERITHSNNYLIEENNNKQNNNNLAQKQKKDNNKNFIYQKLVYDENNKVEQSKPNHLSNYESDIQIIQIIN